MEDKETNGDKITMHERIAKLETQVETILTNHLPHIQKAVDGLSMKFWAIIVLLFGNLVGIITSLAIALIK